MAKPNSIFAPRGGVLDPKLRNNKRTGDNTRYSMRDIALGAFSVFFTQSPSFLAHQTSLKMAKGKSNAETIFGIDQIPSDNHIRDILDEVPPDQVFPIYHEIFSAYEQNEILDSFRSFGGTLLLPLDGVWYFSSKVTIQVSRRVV